jgi:hypothetical protein
VFQVTAEPGVSEHFDASVGDPMITRLESVASLRRASLLMSALLLTIAAACGDEPRTSSSPEGGRIQVVDLLLFEAGELGTSQEASLRVENVGTGALIVDDATAVPLSVGTVEVVGPELPVRIEVGEHRDLVATFTPRVCEPAQGTLGISSSDPETPLLYVPISVEGVAEALAFDAASLDFGRVPAGTCRTLQVALVNSGVCSAAGAELAFEGDGGFAVTRVAGDDAAAGAPVTVAPGATVEVDVQYCAADDESAQSALSAVRAGAPTLRVALRANAGTPCLDIDAEDGIAYGPRFVDASHLRNVTARNCSATAPLQLSDITLRPHPELGGRDRFALEARAGIDLTGPITLEPGESVAWSVLYTPLTTGDHGAMLLVRSSDAAKAELEIELTGSGSEDACLVPVVEVVDHTPTAPGGPVVVEALTTLTLDATEGGDTEGAFAIYQWEVLAQPDVPLARFFDDPQSPTPSVFLSIPGTYRFGLRVVDRAGVESCEVAEVEVEVVTTDDVFVAAVWYAPADQDPADEEGPDLDLHFLHPNGDWEDHAWDAHWGARSPNWGNTVTDDDDPEVLLDSTSGSLPEVVRLSSPEGTQDEPFHYDVGVHSFSDHDLGPSSVFVLVWVRGELALRVALEALERRQFWHAATIEWPSGTVERVSRVYPSGFPP